MFEPIVNTKQNVTLLGGGAVDAADLVQALGRAPVLVAADGGANHAILAGHLPDAVIGDMDSIQASVRAAIPPDRLFAVAEQDSTDFDKCLGAIRAPLILGLGFMGPRLDHLLATLSGLTRQPATRCILLGAQDIAFLCPSELVLGLAPGTRLSLFPFGAVAGHSSGLHWPIAGLAFAPDAMIGTSNRVTAPRQRITVDGPRMVVIMPRECLPAAMAALSAAPVWPR